MQLTSCLATAPLCLGKLEPVILGTRPTCLCKKTLVFFFSSRGWVWDSLLHPGGPQSRPCQQCRALWCPASSQHRPRPYWEYWDARCGAVLRVGALGGAASEPVSSLQLSARACCLISALQPPAWRMAKASPSPQWGWWLAWRARCPHTAAFCCLPIPPRTSPAVWCSKLWSLPSVPAPEDLCSQNKASCEQGPC